MSAGTVICCPGTSTGAKWFSDHTASGKFVSDLRADGFAVHVAQSASREWSTLNSAKNPDIQAVANTVLSQGFRGPFFLVGHSKGGAFASRFAVASVLKITAVQYSNASGIRKILRSDSYTPRSLFCYSKQDPATPVAEVLDAIRILHAVGNDAESRELSREYGPVRGKNHHEFYNTSGTTIAFFRSSVETAK